MWQCAGIIGVDPGPLTLRELVAMAEARSRQQWHHTAALLALIANCHRDAKRQRPYRPEDFLPRFSASEHAPVSPITDLSLLKAVFVDRPRSEHSR